MALVVKWMAIGMVLAVMLATALAVTGGAAEAHPSKSPVAFVLAKSVYRHVTNERYGIIYRDVRNDLNGRVGDVMEHAAMDVCKGTLFEDWSCRTQR